VSTPSADLEEARAELAFELLNALRQRGLGEVHPLGRAGEMPLGRDRDE